MSSTASNGGRVGWTRSAAPCAIPLVAVLATDYIYARYGELYDQLPEKVEALLEQQSGVTEYSAMAAMIRASFAKGMTDIDPTYAKPPKINQTAVTTALVNYATEPLDLVEHVSESK